MKQVFQNLISNGIKFHKNEERIQINISAQSNSDWVTFSIEDNGIGIEQQFLDKIFVIFQRLHTRDNYEGTGIGLALCNKVIERHGGRIWCESEIDKGSTFYFTLKKAI